MYEYDFPNRIPNLSPKPASDRAATICLVGLLVVVLCMIGVALSACGTPHRKTAAEIRQEKAHAAKQRAFERRKRAAEARVERAQKRAKIAAMPRTPPGISQMDSTHFYVKAGYEGNTRDLCRSEQSSSPAGIAAIDPAPNGSEDMIITCNNAEHEYRHEPFTTTTSTSTHSDPARK